MKLLIPPIKIQGKKTKLVEWILSFIPQDYRENKIYVEPFVGSGVVGFNFNPKRAIFSDINPYIIRFYQDLKEDVITPDEIKLFLISEGEKLRKWGEEYYYEVRDRFNKHPNSLDFLFLNRASFNGVIRFNRQGRFNVPFCKKADRFSKSYITKIYNQVSWLYVRIKENDWTFLNKDFREVLKEVDENYFVYLDPPYIARHSDYYNSWNEKDEKDLFEIIKRSRFLFILSSWYKNNYRENNFIKLYEKLDGIAILTKEHFYLVRGRKENSVDEAIITNIADVSVERTILRR